MKIAIVGSGAMGSVYGALLADCGNEVWLIDRWAEHIAAIREYGIHVTGASGERTVRLPASTDHAAPGVCELVVIATKAFDTTQAARDAAPLLGPSTVLLTIQNGLGNKEQIEAVYGPDNLLVGVAGGFGAHVPAPGHSHHEGMETIGLAEARGRASERLERVAQAFREAGFSVHTYDNPETPIWMKLMANIGGNALATVTSQRAGQMGANPWTRELRDQLIGEAFAVAQAKGIQLPYGDPQAFASSLGQKIANAPASMLQDMLAGRPTEIDALNGAIVREAAALGLSAPFNKAITLLVKALEEKVRTHGVAYGLVPPLDA